ncbi:FAD-dependent oxidoreductase [Brachybacterium timonense]|uniref:oxidoreductase n=1 Tax=Brachybacterium timonense TaxID=2050896 RepID=UPI000D0ADBB1|nr:FAD-dependent oxidoreductase [Brachybacterium timonense]
MLNTGDRTRADLDPLLTPWKIGNVEIKNRVVLTSMGGTNLFGWMEKNHFDQAGADFMRTVAENEVGLVLPGCQAIYNPIGGQWLHRNKKMYRDLAEWMPQLHRTGAKLFVQLTAGFGRSFAISEMMEKIAMNPALKKVAKPILDIDKVMAAPSPTPNRWSDKVSSREMTLEEIQEFIDSFAETSALLQEAGVDGVEIHAVHEGYLLDQFAMPYTNHRTDQYGGSLENRLRFATDIVKAIKARCGKEFPVSLRYSVTSKTKGFNEGALPGEEFTEAGRTLEESEKAARILQDAGYDMLNCDNGTYDAWYWAHPPIYMPENCNLADVEHIRKFVDIPVVCAGRMDPYVGADSVAAGRIDAVGFARSFLADPAWFAKLIADKPEDVRPCIYCHLGCFNMASWKGVPNVQSLGDSLNLSRCAVNAETMQKNRHYIKKTSSAKRVVIVGGGIAGMECARVLTERGHTPVIYESSDHLGGVVAASAKEESKAPMGSLLNWFTREMERLNVDVHLNTPVLPGKDGALVLTDGTQIASGDDHVVIATGSTAKKLPIPGFDHAIDAIDFLHGKADVGQKVVVLGGGVTGCELAYDLHHHKGKEPVIVEMKHDLIAQEGICLANSSYLRDYFALHKVPVHLETQVQRIEDGTVICTQADGTPVSIPCDSVISAVGYTPQPLDAKRSRKRTHIIGDCDEIGNVKTAVWSAYKAAMKID